MKQLIAIAVIAILCMWISCNNGEESAPIPKTGEPCSSETVQAAMKWGWNQGKNHGEIAERTQNYESLVYFWYQDSIDFKTYVDSVKNSQ